ncbi:MAG: hypothetical protein AAF602_16615, partial [Myxococcota bacterium]
LDDGSVANAEALDPGSSARWSDVLASPTRAADPWVLVWLGDSAPPTPPVAPGARRASSDVIRVDLGWLSGFRTGWGASLDGRVSFGRLGLGLEGGYESRGVGLLDDQRLVEHVRTVGITAGPRWVAPNGREAFPFASAQYASWAVTSRTDVPGPDIAVLQIRDRTLALQLGAIGVLPLERRGRVALRLDGRGEIQLAEVNNLDERSLTQQVWLPRNGVAATGAWDLLFRFDGQLQVGFGYEARLTWYLDPLPANLTVPPRVRTVSAVRGTLGLRF